MFFISYLHALPNIILILTKIFSKEFKSACHSVRVLCLGTVADHIHAYHEQTQPITNRPGEPLPNTAHSNHTSQTNWNLGVKVAQAQYGWPSVSMPTYSLQGREKMRGAVYRLAVGTQMTTGTNFFLNISPY